VYGCEVMAVGRALETTFSAVKMNYNVLGNWVPHLHTHIVPRYADDPRPGWPFPFPEPDPPSMPQERLERDAALLRAALAVPAGDRRLADRDLRACDAAGD